MLTLNVFLHSIAPRILLLILETLQPSVFPTFLACTLGAIWLSITAFQRSGRSWCQEKIGRQSLKKHCTKGRHVWTFWDATWKMTWVPGASASPMDVSPNLLWSCAFCAEWWTMLLNIMAFAWAMVLGEPSFGPFVCTKMASLKDTTWIPMGKLSGYMCCSHKSGMCWFMRPFCTSSKSLWCRNQKCLCYNFFCRKEPFGTLWPSQIWLCWLKSSSWPMRNLIQRKWTVKSSSTPFWIMLVRTTWSGLTRWKLLYLSQQKKKKSVILWTNSFCLKCLRRINAISRKLQMKWIPKGKLGGHLSNKDGGKRQRRREKERDNQRQKQRWKLVNLQRAAKNGKSLNLTFHQAFLQWADAIENHAGEFPDGAAEFSDGPVLPGDAAEAEPDSAQVVARDIPDDMTLQELRDLNCQNQAVEAAAEVPVEAAAEVPAEAAAEVPAEAAAEVPAEAAAEVPVPPPPVVPPEPAQPRAARRAEMLDWTDVTCSYCHSICGQIKYDPNPGNREPIWVMRVREQDGQWPTQGRNFRRRLTRLIGESDELATKWCRSQRTCCQTNKRVDFPVKAGKGWKAKSRLPPEGPVQRCASWASQKETCSICRFCILVLDIGSLHAHWLICALGMSSFHWRVLDSSAAEVSDRHLLSEWASCCLSRSQLAASNSPTKISCASLKTFSLPFWEQWFLWYWGCSSLCTEGFQWKENDFVKGMSHWPSMTIDIVTYDIVIIASMLSVTLFYLES